MDSYVVETPVHFPSDINLLWDAARKCLTLIGQITEGCSNSTWRKHKYWLRRIRSKFSVTNRVMFRGGRNKSARLESAALDYLKLSRFVSHKLKSSRDILQELSSSDVGKALRYEQLRYYEEMLDKHISLVKRRLIFKEEIPHEEKVFSLFEPYTRWINKGKSGGRIELGLPVTIASDQFGFILHHRVMESEVDVDVAVPIAESLMRWGHLESLSFDKGFWSPANYSALCSSVKQLIMPKKGRLNKGEALRESSKEFIRLRHKHSAVESDINALEHHGLNRCPDKGLPHFKRYVSLGILSLNLHRLGNELLEKDRKMQKLTQAA